MRTDARGTTPTKTFLQGTQAPKSGTRARLRSTITSAIVTVGDLTGHRPRLGLLVETLTSCAADETTTKRFEIVTSVAENYTPCRTSNSTEFPRGVKLAGWGAGSGSNGPPTVCDPRDFPDSALLKRDCLDSAVP